MLDVFAQHLHARVEQFVALGRVVLDRGDQLFERAVLDLGFVEQVLAVADRSLARGGIEDLFLDLRMRGQRDADLLRHRLLAILREAAILVFLEEIRHFLVVGLQQLDRVVLPALGTGAGGGAALRGGVLASSRHEALLVFQTGLTPTSLAHIRSVRCLPHRR
jgi:hypothetical protein